MVEYPNVRWCVLLIGSLVESTYRHNQTITLAGDRFNKRGIVMRIAECVAQFSDGGVKTLVKVNKRVASPQLLLQLFAGDHLACTFKQRGEDLKGFILNVDQDTPMVKFAF